MAKAWITRSKFLFLTITLKKHIIRLASFLLNKQSKTGIQKKDIEEIIRKLSEHAKGAAFKRPSIMVG
jgi:hypothetical protein